MRQLFTSIAAVVGLLASLLVVATGLADPASAHAESAARTEQPAPAPDTGAGSDQTASVFTPNISITVPDSESVYPASFFLQLAPKTGSDSGCTKASNVLVKLEDGVFTPVTVQLVDRPSSSAAPCAYTVTFPTEVLDLRLEEEFHPQMEFTAASPDIEIAYYAVTEFDPIVLLTLPEPAADFAGTQFTVVFTPAVGVSERCTQSATVILEIDSDGSVSETEEGQAVRLIDDANSSDDPNVDPVICSYTAAFPAETGSLGLLDFSTAVVFAGSPTAAATYVRISHFDPAVALSLPASAAEHAGTEFAVRFAPAPNAPARCTQTATVTARVAPDGSVAETPASQNVLLIDNPDVAGNSENCSYTATFPAGAGRLTRTSAASVTVSADSPTASATYTVLGFFTPQISITVPDSVAGYPATFPLTFTPAVGSNAACTRTVTVPLTLRNGVLSHLNLQLIERLVGRGIVCAYTVAFPDGVNVLRRTSPASVKVSAASPTASATYARATQFDPQVLVTLPRPASSFANTEIAVTFTPVAAANERCTQSATVVLLVSVEGIAAKTIPSRGVRLRDDVGAAEPCAYTARFPTAVIDLRLQSAPTVVISAANPTATAAYIDIFASRFEPQISITVPEPASDYPGSYLLRFAPTAGSNPGCSQASSVTLTLENGQLSELDLALVNTPGPGLSACGYTVAFPTQVGELLLRGDAEFELSAASPAVAATYALVTRFDPEISVALPAPAAAYAGNEFPVMLAPTAGSNPGCTQTATVTVQVAADGAVAEAPDSQSVRLVDDPVAGTGICAYTAAFPAAVGNLRPATAAEVEVSAASPAAAATYAAITEFDPAVAITLPSPASDHAGTEFEVMLTPAAGAAAECTQSAAITVRVGSDGSVTEIPASQSVRLVDDLITEAECVYAAAFPSRADELYRVSAAEVMVSGANPTAAATYARIVYFDPSLDITLPDPAAAYADTEFEVTFARQSGEAFLGCTELATVTARVASNGSVAEIPASQAVRLIATSYTNTGTCRYTAMFPVLSGALELSVAPTGVVSSFFPTAAATYAQLPQFDPAVAIRLPTPAADYAGIEFTATFAPAAGAPAFCTPSAAVTVHVGSDGTTAETSASQSVRLVDVPTSGTPSCSYAATFSTDTNRLRRTSAAEVMVSADNPTAAATYEAIDTLFDPAVAITLPTPATGFAGTEFTVTFAPAAGSVNAACTQTAAVTVRVASDGSVAEIPASRSVRLIDDPVSGVGTCAYTATFPDDNSRLSLATASAVEITAASPTAAASYTGVSTRFDPAVSLSLPASPSTYAGTQIAVTFAPAPGGPSLGCTLSATVVLRVAPNGSTAETPASQSVRLVNEPFQVAGTCSYTATFQEVAGSLRRATAAEVEVSAASPTASATYAPNVILFDPLFSITLPDPASDFAGTEIPVAFMPAPGVTNSGCTQSATVTLRIGSDGTVAKTPASQSVRLVDDPATGATIGQRTCSYVATFPAEPGDLILSSAATDLVDEADLVAAAVYTRFRFDPGVSLTLPDPASAYAGTEFTVTFAPTTGSPASGCTPSATVTVRVAPNGDVLETPASQSVRLIDDPVDAAGSCTYRAAFTEEAGELRRLRVTQDSVSAANPTAAATYAAVTRFDPTVALTLPAPATDFAGAEFTVTIAPAIFSTNPRCTQTAAITVRIGSDGTAAETPASQSVRLVDDAIIGPGPCVYAATFPDSFPTTSGQLSRTSSATRFISADDPTAAATYTAANRFDPGVALTLPDPASDYADTEFAVTLAPAPGSLASGCTQTTAITVRIASNGAVAETPASQAITLVDEPTPGANSCSYTATFPAQVGELGRSSAAEVIISAASPTASATYAAITRFDPSVAIRLPAPASNFAGTEFTVTFVPAASSTNLNCTPSAAVTVRVASNGAIAETPASQAVRLIDDPIVGADPCSYTATFSTRSTRLVLAAASGAAVSNASPTAAATYSPLITRWTPNVALTLPTPASSFEGTEFAVMFTPAPGSTNPGCTQSAEVTVRVGAGGEIAKVPASQSVTLVDDPVAGVGGTCAYTAAFPDRVNDLVRTSDAEVEVAESTPTAAATYAAITEFDPAVAITLPTPASTFDGTEITVTFAPAPGSTNPDCTQSAAVTVRVDSTGAVAELPASQSVRLVDDPIAGLGTCSYTAAFPAEIGQLRRTSTASVVVSSGSATATATYAANPTEFNPAVALTLPAPASNFAGTEFEITFAPAPGSTNPGCTQTAAVTVRVDGSGNTAELPARQSVRLVDDPILGSGTCAYTATFPNEVNRLRLATAAEVEVTAADATAAATYDPIITRFDPAVALTLPDPARDFTDTEFAVTFAPAPSSTNPGCTQSETVTLRIDGNGAVTETPASQSVRLVDDPVAGTGGTCSYTATFPTDSGMLRLATAASVVVSAANPSAAATYAAIVAEFDPEISLSVPQIILSNIDSVGLTASIVPAPGSTDPRCTQSASLGLALLFDGTWLENSESLAVRLVSDLGAGVAPCSYTATFQQAASGAYDGVEVELIRTSSPVEISAANRTVAAVYSGTSQFDPEVALSLPIPASTFANTEFEVTFAPAAGAPAFCTDSAAVTARVDNTGAVVETAASQTVRLVRFPGFGAETCSYMATFPPSSGRLSLASIDTAVVSATSRTADATYDPIITRFNPAVALTLPAPASNFSGTEFEVTFAPAPGSINPGCTQSAAVTVRIAGSGSVAELPASQAVMLVDDPVAGVGGTCAYTATFPAGANRLRLATAAPVVVSGSSITAAATYDPVITRFNPAVALTLPAPASNFDGTEFTVTFAPTTGSTNPGCTQSATVTVRVGADGSVSELPASQLVMLIDDPVAGVGGTCAYTATFPPEVNQLRLAATTEIVISADSATAAATYAAVPTLFDPAVSITLPNPALNFAGAEFTVTFTPTADSTNPGCTQSAAVTVRVAPNGSVVETDASRDVMLVDDPIAGTGGACAYTATFPLEVGVLNRSSAASVEVVAASPIASATYIAIATLFDLEISLTLIGEASVDIPTDIAVLFAPIGAAVAGASASAAAGSSGANRGCTSSAVVTMRVAPDGSVSETPAGRDVRLIDDPGSGPCSYTATFPAASGDLRRLSAASAVVSAANPEVSAAYQRVLIRFNPAVAITLPAPASNFADTDFTVAFVPTADSTNPNCTPAAILIARVAADGSVVETPASQAVRLVDDPVLGSGTCAYTATISTESDQLRLATATPIEVSADSPIAAAIFDPVPTLFDPAAALTLPAPASNFAGTEFVVMFAPTASSTNPGCTQTAAITLRVAPNGDVSEVDASRDVRLVDDPIAGTGTCAYTATFSTESDRLRLATAAAVVISADSPTAAAAFDPVAVLFDPAVAITLPAPASNFAGTEFVVRFAPTAGSTNPGCTQSAEVTVRVAGNGNAAETLASQAVRLVDDPVSGTGTCAYAATFPSEVNRLRLATAAAVEVSTDSPTAAATYDPVAVLFDPGVAITLPQPASNFAGTEFAVRFAPTASSTNPGCTQSAEVSVRVASDGSVVETEASRAVRLVDDPIAGTGTCAYTATFSTDSTRLRLAGAASAAVSADSPVAAAAYVDSFVPTDPDPGSSQTPSTRSGPRSGQGPGSGQTPGSGSAPAPEETTDSGNPELTLVLSEDADFVPNQSVVVSVAPAAGCNPGAADGLASTTITDDSPTASVSAGTLSNACDWVVTFNHADGTCEVAAQAVDSFGANRGAAATGVTGMLRLAGNGDPNSNAPLRVSSSNGSAVNTIRLTVTDSCHTTFSTFDPAVSIALPVPAAAYAGTEFAVVFTPTTASTNPACTQTATLTLRVAPTGAVVETETSRNVRLVDNPAIGATIGQRTCSYTATFSAETGVLRRTAVATEVVSAARTTAAAVYAATTIDVVVATTYPVDALYTTADRATYEIIVEAPCGNFTSQIPSGFNRLGGSTTVQVFPGTVIVYGQTLNGLTQPGSKTFTTNAYHGANTDQPCTITVIETGGPDNCQAIGGNTQTQTYLPGLTALIFDFTHTCDNTARTADRNRQGSAGSNSQNSGSQSSGPPGSNSQTPGPMRNLPTG